MPYAVRRRSAACPSGKPWAVINIDSGERLGCHATKEQAEAQRRALYANEQRLYTRNQGGS